MSLTLLLLLFSVYPVDKHKKRGFELDDLVTIARQYLGKPYCLGGIGSNGNRNQCIDCSGLTMIVFQRIGSISLPHKASMQASYGQAVEREDIQGGDLIFRKDNRRGIYHVGLVLERVNNQTIRYIHATKTQGKVVMETCSIYSTLHISFARRIDEFKHSKRFIVPPKPSTKKPADKVTVVREYPQVSQRLLITQDVEGKTKHELSIMRNELFAIYGYRFHLTQSVIRHFEQKAWYMNYTGRTTKDSEYVYWHLLSDIERANIEFIRQFE